MISRRTFQKTTAALAIGALLDAGNGDRAAANTSKAVRLPLSEFSQRPDLVDALRTGVQVMRSRPGSDHRSWFWQGAVHAVSDEIFEDEVLRDPNVANVDRERYWDKCPHSGRRNSADFLIWHRAYLYYFERILRDASGNPELAIPYWDYDQKASRLFPSLFGSLFLGPNRTNPNSLYHPNRELAFVTGRYEISEAVASATEAKASKQFFSTPGVRGFAGDPAPSDRPIAGWVESRPHNDIHVAVGGVIGTHNGAMADVPTAAFDPVFWVHHANVDRMWAEWAIQPGLGWGSLPPNDWLDEKPWIFKDVDGSEQAHSRRHYLDRRNLQIAFGSDQPGAVELELPHDVSLFSAPFGPARTETRIFGRRGQLVASPSSPGKQLIRLASSQILSRRPALLSAGRRPQVILELRDIKADRVPSHGFSVHLRPAGISGNGSDTRYRIGTIDLFGLRHATRSHSGHDQLSAQAFDATHMLDSIQTQTWELSLEPYPLLVPPAGERAVSRPDAIEVGEIVLRLIDG